MGSRPTLGSIGGWASLTLLALIPFVGACGDDPLPPVELPSAADAQEFLAVTPGSCIRYRFNTTQRATARVTQDAASLPGRTTSRWSFSLASGGLADERFFEPQDDGELRLLRFDTSDANGLRVSTRYACAGQEQCPDPDEQEPLMLRLAFDMDMQAGLTAGDRYEVVTTPASVSMGVATAERHTVVVQRTDVDVPVPEGTTEPGVELTYSRQVGTDAPVTSTWRVVPGKGIAQIQEGGVQYQACSWRYCDAAGNCEGAADCNALTCN
ncbi:MAG: hypothetical protein AAFZ18_08795 [Myxococcota bacterium]